MERSELVSLLRAHSVPVDDWGAGEAKTVDHLLSEINSGEAILSIDNGVIQRRIVGVSIEIIYSHRDGRRVRLIEERQVFRDGRERRRKLEGSIGEKLRPGENPTSAAHRALREELGIQVILPLIPREVPQKSPTQSNSFPGLLTVYDFHHYFVVLPHGLYRVEGYVECQEDKTTYFTWQHVP